MIATLPYDVSRLRVESVIYKGHKIERTGPHENDFRVAFSGRARWGTIDELRMERGGN